MCIVSYRTVRIKSHSDTCSDDDHHSSCWSGSRFSSCLFFFCTCRWIVAAKNPSWKSNCKGNRANFQFCSIQCNCSYTLNRTRTRANIAMALALTLDLGLAVGFERGLAASYSCCKLNHCANSKIESSSSSSKADWFSCWSLNMRASAGRIGSLASNYDATGL